MAGPSRSAVEESFVNGRVRRRSIAAGVAWSVPVIWTAAAAPALAASCKVLVEIDTAGLSGSGFDLYLRDTKSTNSATNTLPSTTTVVNLRLRVTCDGQPLPGAAIVVSGDNTKDGEGNFMIGFSPTTQTSGFGESSVQKTASVVTDAAGLVTVKVSTATYSSVDCGSIPRSGTWWVMVDGTTIIPFTYEVYDGSSQVVC